MNHSSFFHNNNEAGEYPSLFYVNGTGAISSSASHPPCLFSFTHIPLNSFYGNTGRDKTRRFLSSRPYLSLLGYNTELSQCGIGIGCTIDMSSPLPPAYFCDILDASSHLSLNPSNILLQNCYKNTKKPSMNLSSVLLQKCYCNTKSGGIKMLHFFAFNI